VGRQLGRLGIDRSTGLLVGRTHLSGTAVSLVGGDLGVPMSRSLQGGDGGVGEEHLRQAHPQLGVPQGTQCVPSFRSGKSPTMFLCHFTTCVVLT
jgi:hypothetical protein